MKINQQKEGKFVENFLVKIYCLSVCVCMMYENKKKTGII